MQTAEAPNTCTKSRTALSCVSSAIYVLSLGDEMQIRVVRISGEGTWFTKKNGFGLGFSVGESNGFAFVVLDCCNDTERPAHIVL